jgi:tRNA(Ile)-lysidine synthase
MFSRGDRLGVAVSGGADSVCLLYLLTELASRWDLSLQVLHVNHNLRGEDSRGDAEFVRTLARRLELPFTLHEIDLLAIAGNLEAAARTARLEFFHERIGSGEVDRVALGHTRSDQAETVLFRFLRGSGVTGLAAIHPVTEEGLVRPMLDVDRGEVEGFLRERGIEWREDATNQSRDFARNRIRHELLPQLGRDWNPGIAEALAHTAEIARAEEEYWEGEIDQLAAVHLTYDPDGAVRLSVEALVALPKAAARRLVRRAFHTAGEGGSAADFDQVDAVLSLARRKSGSGRVQVPGLEVLRSFEQLRFGPPLLQRINEMCVTVPARIGIPGCNLCISLEMIENWETSSSPANVYNSQMGCLDWSRLSGRLKLRNWQPGDQYTPNGVPAAKKIKSLFQQARIPVWERTQWPVLTDAGVIVWTRRFGAASAVAAGSGCRKILAVSEVEIR